MSEWMVTINRKNANNDEAQYGTAERLPFDEEGEATTYYNEVVQQGLPEDCTEASLYLDHRVSSTSGVPRKINIVLRHCRIHMDKDGGVHTNHYPNIIQV